MQLDEIIVCLYRRDTLKLPKQFNLSRKTSNLSWNITNATDSVYYEQMLQKNLTWKSHKYAPPMKRWFRLQQQVGMNKRWKRSQGASTASRACYLRLVRPSRYPAAKPGSRKQRMLSFSHLGLVLLKEQPEAICSLTVKLSEKAYLLRTINPSPVLSKWLP